MSKSVCSRLQYWLPIIGNLYNSIIVHAQMNVIFYSHSVHNASSCADGLEGYSLLQCHEAIVIPCDKYGSHVVIMLPVQGRAITPLS